MSIIHDALEQIADTMRVVPGLTVFVEQEPSGVDPVAPACSLDVGSLSMETSDYGNRLRANVSSVWTVRTSTVPGGAPLEDSLDMVESIIKAFSPESFPPGPICSLNVSAFVGDARDPGSKYTEPTVTITFFVILDR